MRDSGSPARPGPRSGVRLLIWRGEDAWRVEAASVGLAREGIVAAGTQVGVDPVGYRLDYRLDARSAS